MSHSCLWLFLMTGLLLSTDPRRRLVHPSDFLDLPSPGSRLLWIGTHPDDEILVAPLLAQLCLDQRLECHVLVLTRGEAGICVLPNGCQPDLASVRSEEMRAAAALFGAQLTMWDWADGTIGSAATVRARWSEAAGGEQKLIERIAAHLEAVAPELVLSFDPRHGSTCHPDHQASGQLVLEALAVARIPTPKIYLLENRVQILEGGRTILFSAASETDLVRFDARRILATTGTTAWEYLIRSARIHASQFSDSQVEAMESIPESDRVLYLLPIRVPPFLTPGEHCRE